ncbi:MAG: hypothetical protein ACLR8L_10095 [Oscillospiraceae bacterium]|jgi:hypothetical protein|nr:MAG TPA: hypothetical protein [Caudoviricetes sp.]DAZ80608.1 MAG TPA: hypothetical protein [Caudoviricetes sp.]
MMERLTYFKDGHWRLDFGGVQYQADFVDRLAAYENSSLSPTGAAKAAEIEEELSEYGYSIERMVELMCADKEGRVVVLPCRGDADIELMRNGVAFKPDHWNIHLTTFAENQPTPSGKKVALLDLREVQESMEGNA